LSITSFLQFQAIPSQADYQAELNKSIEKILLKYVSIYKFNIAKVKQMKLASSTLIQNMHKNTQQKPIFTEDMWQVIKNEVRKDIKSYYIGLQENDAILIEEKLWASIEDKDFFKDALSLIDLPPEFMEKMNILTSSITSVNEEDITKKNIIRAQEQQTKLLAGIDINALKLKQEKMKKEAEDAEKAEDQKIEVQTKNRNLNNLYR
jgi:hypothetical protein